MMEGRDYADDDEGLFRFDTEEEEAAFMNNLNEDDLMEPLTPVGSAEAVIAPTVLHHAAAAAAAAASGRPHSNSHSHNFSSVNAWQQPEPEPASPPPPPPLSYSPSPSTTPATHHRPADRRRLSSRRSRQSQLSHQGSDQSLAQHSHRPAPVPTGSHHDDLQQLDTRTLLPQHQPSVQDQVGDDSLIDDENRGQIQHPPAVSEDEPSGDELRENGFVEIDADGVQAMFNGNEADRITAQKFQSEVLKTIKQNGKVVYMVGQATAQWWLSSEMQKRRRAAARRMLDIGGAVASSAGNVIMNNTPIGGVVTTVSDNVTAFRAAPFLYTMQGLGIMKKDKPATAVLSPTTTDQHVSNDRCLGPDEVTHFAPSPAIVQDEDEDDMLGVLNFDDEDDI